MNTYTTGYQSDPDVAVDAGGSFMVVWTSYNQAGSGNSIFGRIFDGPASPVTGEFQVDSYTAAYQYFPQVAASDSGSFVVAWESIPLDGSNFGIAARMFDITGAPAGPEFQVNTFTTGGQGEPAIAMNSRGDFLVAWDGDHQDGDQDGVFAQLFDVTGAKVGGEFQVNTYTTGQQDDPKIAADPSGELIVVWPSIGQDGSSDGIFGQLVDSTGATLGGEFQVNTYTTLSQDIPSVATGPAGTFTVVWEGEFGDGGYVGVIGQRFAAHSAELTGPAGPLDCSDPADPSTWPTFTWDTDTYDSFKVFMGSSPGFEKGTRVSSGKQKILTGSWTPPAKKWKSACRKALTQAADPNSPVLYVTILGKDRDLPKSNPSRNRFSPVVEMDVAP